MNPENTVSTSGLLSSKLASLTTPTTWVEFREGFSLKINFVPKARFRSLVDKSTELVFDPKQKVRTPRVNNESFQREFLKIAVSDWKLSLRALSKLAPLDLSGNSEAELDAELPYSQDELTKLLDVVYDLDGFITESVMDMRTFRPTMEEETKN